MLITSLKFIKNITVEHILHTKSTNSLANSGIKLALHVSVLLKGKCLNKLDSTFAVTGKYKDVLSL